jgi:dipeptidyl aminopeptidase/acylaminoacyl peptidase
MRLPILLAFCALSALPESLTPEQSVQIRQLSDLRFSPDGSRLAFTVTEPVTGRRAESHVWIFEPGSGRLTQWTHSAKSERMPRWSPDGRTLAFLSDREDNNQIWMTPTAGGEAVRLTTGKHAIQSFHWSRDGRSIAFLASDQKSPEQEKREKDLDDASVADSHSQLSRVWILDVAGKGARQLTSGSWHVADLDWFPDNSRLAVIATDRPADDRRTDKLYSLSVADGKMEMILEPSGPFRGIQVSPDGKQIAYVASPEDGPAAHDLFVLPLDTRTPHNLSHVIDRPVQSFEWRGPLDIGTLFNDGFRTNFRVLGERPSTLAADANLDIAAVALDPQGRAVTVQESATSPAELHWNGAAVSHFNDTLRSLSLAQPEFYRYKSFDGTEIEAALYRGADAIPNRPQPLVLLIHGGPAGNWRNRFDGLTQLLTAHGYAVVQPNIRGSVAYGQKFLTSNRGDWGGGDYKDAMAGVDDLIRRGVADPDRLAIAGWSYGGYMAEWAITQTNRFKAAASGAGMADLATEFGTESHSSGDEWYYGIPYENLAGFQKSSPIVYIRNAKTPTLILQGEADTTDPLSQSQMLYRGLKRYNVPTELVVYPREPHGFREEKHIIDRDRRIVEWIAKYLGSAQ